MAKSLNWALDPRQPRKATTPVVKATAKKAKSATPKDNKEG